MVATCAGCGAEFKPARSTAVYCSSACRQRAYRKRNAPTVTVSDDEFERRVRAEVNKRLAAEVKKRLAGERSRMAWRGFTRDEIKLIRRCLHPDRSASDKSLNEAFRVFSEAEMPVYTPKVTDVPANTGGLKRRPPRRR